MSIQPWRILVVDDYPDAADLTADLLRLEGYAVAIARQGLQAVEVARVFKPDLVLMDINMPVMDGLAAARILRQEQSRGAGLVLIAHTAKAMPSDVQKALDAGFDRHVSKPISPDELFGLIQAYLPGSVRRAGSPDQRDDEGGRLPGELPHRSDGGPRDLA